MFGSQFIEAKQPNISKLTLIISKKCILLNPHIIKKRTLNYNKKYYSYNHITIKNKTN